MKTECVRCHKSIDTVQGYKFSPTEYVCMSCYDEFKAERAAKAKKQHKNPLLDKFGTEPAPTIRAQQPQQAQRPQQAPARPAPPQPSQPSSPRPPESEMFAPKAPPQPAAAPVGAPKPASPKAPPSADICDVCQKPIADFKVPLKGGKKVCMGCNDILRSVAKSMILNFQCPHCGKDIKLTED